MRDYLIALTICFSYHAFASQKCIKAIDDFSHVAPAKLDQVVKTQTENLKTEIFTPLTIGQTSSYYLNGELIRVMRVNGEEVRFSLPSDWVFKEGATNGDSSFYVRISVDLDRQQTTTDVYPLKQHAVLDDEINKKMEFVFDTYKKRKIVSEDDIQEMRTEENQLDGKRKALFVVSDKNYGTLALSRLYDGTQSPSLNLGPVRPNYGGQNVHQVEASALLPIERKFPHIDFRKETKDIIEIGRFAVDSNLANANQALLQGMAIYLINKMGQMGLKSPNEKIYVLAKEVHKKIYLKPISEGGYGFSLKYTPEELHLAEKDEPLYILEMRVDDFVRNFYREMPVMRRKK